MSAPKVTSSLQAAVKAPTPKPDVPVAGSNLREAVLELMKSDNSSKGKTADGTKNGVEKKEIVQSSKTTEIESSTTEALAEKGKKDVLTVENQKEMDKKNLSDEKDEVLGVAIVPEMATKISDENAETKSVQLSKVDNSNAVQEEKVQHEPSSSLASAVAAENSPVASSKVEQPNDMEISVKRIVFPKELLIR